MAFTRFPGGGSGATAVSHPGAPSGEFPRFMGLARQSHYTAYTMPKWAWILIGMGALAVPGCLISDPPEFKGVEKTPPVLNLSKAIPSTTEILSVAIGETHQFLIPVRSEDLGDKLVAGLYTNYGIEGEQQASLPKRIPSSTFDQLGRVISFPWTVAAKPGSCLQLTLVVTHEENTDEFSRPIERDNDVALATWWLDVQPDLITDPAGEPARLSDCPSGVGGLRDD
jgi:hypothetical protein